MSENPSQLVSRPIPASGEALPLIGVGTWQTFDVGNNAAARAPLREVLKTLVNAGGRAIDSSPMYGSSESVTGELIAELGVRDRLFIATKVWVFATGSSSPPRYGQAAAPKEFARWSSPSPGCG
jgi:diketogulonate reductase-like aldo/keto reductase